MRPTRNQASESNQVGPPGKLGSTQGLFQLVFHNRTPLEIIMSSADNLQRYHDRLAPQKHEQLLSTIHKSVRRMAGMMEEVLVLGRLETDRIPFKPAPFDLRAFCQRRCDEIESATGKRCPLRLQIDALPEKAFGDACCGTFSRTCSQTQGSIQPQNSRSK